MNALIKKYWKRIITALPLLSIAWASFYPMQQRGQQALVLFTLIWFYVFIIFEVFSGH